MNSNEETFYIVPEETHNSLVKQAYAKRGFNQAECDAAARFSSYATHHGIRTHNALKARHLEDLFGSLKCGIASTNLGKPLLMRQWMPVLNWRINMESAKSPSIMPFIIFGVVVM